MMSTKVEMLRSLSYLEGARPDLLAWLADRVVEKSFQPGQVILEEGSIGGDIYLIVEGLAQVVKGEGAEEVELARRGPGDLLGEMGFVEARPRFATVRALEPTRMLEVPEQTVRSLLTKEPQLLFRTVQVLSARLRESDLLMISDLGRKNKELARAYHELQEAQAALVEKERMERELELARELQQSILPHEFPRFPGFACAACSRPAWQVGGDFYDVIPLGKQRVGLVMADVSDKGMAAALFMALTRSLIRAEAWRSSSPRQVLLSVHRLLLEISQANMFVTVVYGVLDLAEGTFRYVRAGHDRPLRFHAATGRCQFLEGDGMLLGLWDPVSLDEVEVVLQPGDMLVLYTDGVTDVDSPSGERFGQERLREAVCDAARESVQDVCDSVFARADQFLADGVQNDDMALLVARMDSTS